MNYFKLNPAVRVGNTDVTMLGVAQYENGRTAVQLFSIIADEDGGDGVAVEPYDTLSVNLPEQSLPDNGKETFFARNYDYHTKTFNAMLQAGVIEVVPGIRGSVGMHGFCCGAKLTPLATETPAED